MLKGLRILISAGLFFLLLLLVLPTILPVESYKPELEAQLSAISGHYVMIDDLSIRLLPEPELTAKGVTIWQRDSGSDGLRVERIRITPDVADLIFDQALVIRQIHLHGLRTNLAFAQNLYAAMTAAPGDKKNQPSVTVEQISGDAVTLVLDPSTTLGPYAFDVTRAAAGGVDEVQISQMDHRAKLRLSPTDHGYQGQLTANRWRLPLGPPLRFDDVRADIALTQGALQVQKLSAQAYGGQIQGTATLSWKDGWQLKGELKPTQVALAPVVQAFDGDGVQGDFSGTLFLQFDGAAFAEIFKHPLVSGNFSIASLQIYTPKQTRPLLVIDELSAHGTVTREGLVTNDTRVVACDGTVSGYTATSWESHWTFKGDLTAQGIDSERCLSGIMETKTISGRFSGSADIELENKTFLTLIDRPKIIGRFKFENGVIYKADLEKASTSRSHTAKADDQTAFKGLEGEARIDNGHITLSNLRIVSASLKASGKLQVDPNKHIDGQLDVGLRSTGSLVSIPIVVSGTMDNPQLRPTGSAMVGGAIGTSVLGPGVGTAIGIHVGNFFGKIGSALKGKEEPKP